MKYYYDVVLSFADEDREYVEECADILTSLGIKVFYDSYEQDVLWGKDLYTFLADIYIQIKRDMQLFLYQSIMLIRDGLSTNLGLLMRGCLKAKRNIYCQFC